VALANIALPLTNAFPGEFLMFNGIFSSTVTQYYLWFTVLGGLSIIFGAVYTLNMIRKVFYGESNALTAGAQDIRWNEQLALGVIVILILWLGICPQTLLNTVQETAHSILNKADVLPYIRKH
jgi:NADH-quinone oxidoreductase subunit M